MHRTSCLIVLLCSAASAQMPQPCVSCRPPVQQNHYQSCSPQEGGSLFSCSDVAKLIQPSDTCFDDFISPMTNFVFFEDPRQVTEVRPIFVSHRVPDNIGTGGAVPAGGSIQLYALQFRVRLSENVSLIAVKDGFIVDNTGGALDTLLADGWGAVAAGLKFTLLRECNCWNSVVSGYDLRSSDRKPTRSAGCG